MDYTEIKKELSRIAAEIEKGENISYGEIAFLQAHQNEIKAEFPDNLALMEYAGIPESLARVKQRYTKGDLHAIAEFLDALTRYNSQVIDDIADAIGYTGDSIRETLGDLAATCWGLIGAFQEHEYADTAQDAEICDIQPLDPYGDNLWNNINQNND